MENNVSFKDYAIVACGTMMPEVDYLQAEGFLDAAKILYTTPGLHQDIVEMENQLIKQINTAKKYAKKIIIIYGGTYCYINTKDPLRTIDTVIDELKEDGYFINRIQNEKCIDMVTTAEEREQIAGGRNVYWMTPGWLKYRDLVYKGWDKATANTFFPAYEDGGIILDAMGFFDKYMEEKPEDVLDFSDWTQIPIEGNNVNMDRFKKILIDAMAEEDK